MSHTTSRVSTLERLEGKGLVVSHEQAGTAERGMRVKRMYRVTAAGQSAAAKTGAPGYWRQVLRSVTPMN